MTNTEGKYNGNIRLFPRKSNRPQHPELLEGEWHDLKSTHCIDNMKMVTLLLTQEICSIQQCAYVFQLIFLNGRMYAVQEMSWSPWNHGMASFVLTIKYLVRICISITAATQNNNTSLALCYEKILERSKVLKEIKRCWDRMSRSKCTARVLVKDISYFVSELEVLILL